MKLMVALPFLANKRAEFSLGYGQLEDNYFQSSVIDFDKDVGMLVGKSILPINWAL